VKLRRRVARLILLGVCLAAMSAGAADLAPKEPDGYRLDGFRAPTPATVVGRAVLDTAAAHRLWQSHAAVFIDVLPAPRRPDGLPPGAIWAPKPHRDIPGSIWLPEFGRGTLTPHLEAWFRANLERATEGNPKAPLVFYCLAECWLSWNATKRAIEWGYDAALWYGEGTDGWGAAGFALAETTPWLDQAE
jgi:PQQ-dependent catabolism-associated CXXCW motif protein